VRRSRLFHLLTALVTGLALSAGIAACGGDDTASEAIPATTPELTAPAGTSFGPVTPARATGTTGTTGATGATGAAPTATTPAASTPATGGAPSTTPAQTQATPNTGGASPGAFSEFCKQNPGACGQ
jgi:hypothetical protein